MRARFFPEEQSAGRAAAREIAGLLKKAPDCVLGLATGHTMIPVYGELVRLHEEQGLSFKAAKIFNLDEYCGIPPSHPQSFRSYMAEHLFRSVMVRDAHIPCSDSPDPEEEADRYERQILQSGGIDLAVLGIGTNGHIGFNEPGTPWETLTHVARLAPLTRERVAARFGGLDEVPETAITMGIRTIMNARNILLLATGAEKSDVLARALLGPVTLEVPASILQLHPHVTVLLDSEGAACLPAEAAPLSPDYRSRFPPT